MPIVGLALLTVPECFTIDKIGTEVELRIRSIDEIYIRVCNVNNIYRIT